MPAHSPHVPDSGPSNGALAPRCLAARRQQTTAAQYCSACHSPYPVLCGLQRPDRFLDLRQSIRRSAVGPSQAQAAGVCTSWQQSRAPQVGLVAGPS